MAEMSRDEAVSLVDTFETAINYVARKRVKIDGSLIFSQESVKRFSQAFAVLREPVKDDLIERLEKRMKRDRREIGITYNEGVFSIQDRLRMAYLSYEKTLREALMKSLEGR